MHWHCSTSFPSHLHGPSFTLIINWPARKKNQQPQRQKFNNISLPSSPHFTHSHNNKKKQNKNAHSHTHTKNSNSSRHLCRNRCSRQPCCKRPPDCSSNSSRPPCYTMPSAVTALVRSSPRAWRTPRPRRRCHRHHHRQPLRCPLSLILWRQMRQTPATAAAAATIATATTSSIPNINHYTSISPHYHSNKHRTRRILPPIRNNRPPRPPPPPRPTYRSRHSSRRKCPTLASASNNHPKRRT